MKRRLKQNDSLPLRRATALAAVLFAVLYLHQMLSAWDEEAASFPDGQSASQEFSLSAPLRENKDIYDLDTNLYDVYISVFPTADEDGNVLDLSAFDLHTSRDRSYNPTLNCNIQILPEGEAPNDFQSQNWKNATIRVRGNSARGALRKSYKVRLNAGAGDFFGQTNLNINKDYQDVSRISTKLSTDLLAEMDNVISYRTYFMRLWLQDMSLPQEEQEFEYQGMYIEVEQPNKTYLRARDLSSEGASLYKARNFAFRPNSALLDVDDPAYSEEAFEAVLGIREGNSHEKLLEMLSAVNDTSRDFEEVFAQYFDEDNYLTWLAFNVLMGNEDIVSQNYLLYSPESSQTWYFIHWDFDGCLYFGKYESGLPISLRGIQRLAISILHQRYFQIPGNLEKLDAKIQELLDTSITRERVASLVETYKPLLEENLAQEPDPTMLMDKPDQQFAYLDGLYDGILHNYDVFKESSQYPLSGFVATPERTEDGAVRFAWDPFFSMKGLPITYSVRVYSDYDMQNLIWEATGLQETSCLMEEGLPNGTYYVLVSGTDSEGLEQISLEQVWGWADGRSFRKDGLREFTLE